MPFQGGSFVAHAVLDTAGFMRGAAQIAAATAGIAGNIAQIGAGVTLGNLATPIVQQILEIPKALINANALIEKDTLAMAAQFDVAANKFKPSAERMARDAAE